MSLKIFTYPNNYRAWKALVAARYSNIDIETPEFDFKAVVGTPEIRKKVATGKVPFLETPHGNLFESNAIARYVARLRPDAGLYGSSFFEAALVDQWLDFSAFELEAARAAWLYPVYEIVEFNGKVYAEAKKDVANAMNILNEHLLHNTYLVGNQITLADIVIVSALVDLYRLVFVPKFAETYQNVTRWFTTCINQAQFASVIGKVEFAKQEKMAPKPKKEADKPKKEKPAQQPKKEVKEAAKEAAPAPVKAEKPKSAVESLPESPMHLDTVKKLFFSQKPYNPKFWEEFWPMFDAQGYSIWRGDYNYDNENTVLFKTGNLLAGFLQRLEGARKYAFGCVYITAPNEDTPPFHVGACFVFRGQEIPAEVMDGGDAEYYTWTKMNVETEKARVQEEFCADKLNGLEVIDRRYFK